MPNSIAVVRLYIVMALNERFKGDWRPEKESVARILIKIGQNKDEIPIVRLRVTAALGSLDPEGKHMMPILVDILKNKEQHEYVRLGAVQGLATIGPPAKESIPLIQEFLQHKNKEFQKAAAQALKKIQDGNRN